MLPTALPMPGGVEDSGDRPGEAAAVAGAGEAGWALTLDTMPGGEVVATPGGLVVGAAPRPGGGAISVVGDGGAGAGALDDATIGGATGSGVARLGSLWLKTVAMATVAAAAAAVALSLWALLTAVSTPGCARVCRPVAVEAAVFAVEAAGIEAERAAAGSDESGEGCDDDGDVDGSPRPLQHTASVTPAAAELQP